jgi:hypothetical protein
MTTRKHNDGDTAGHVQCDRCGAVMGALDFNVHQCRGKRDLSKMPINILRKLAYKQITEDEAWRLTDSAL